MQDELIKNLFKPVPRFNEVGNFIEWYLRDELGFSEQIMVDGKNIGSVIRSCETKEIIGVKINLESVKYLTK